MAVYLYLHRLAGAGLPGSKLRKERLQRRFKLWQQIKWTR